ncbi:MAG: indolepyruvate ferredoxin oxidoreductase family protein [Anaerolineae bacterium]|nr:indolepyruvate ferredoxin oxidoreductase family protein [Anaerolineae bacterium]
MILEKTIQTPFPDFSLDDKYLIEDGQIVLSGTQALVRLPMDQHRADKRRGLSTATMIAGYRGSPLGAIDLTLEQSPALLKQHQIVFIPAVNEDLAATMVWGSQTANMRQGAKYDGVLGMWYGKGPGVDRSGDVFKHANFSGIGKNGGVLALAGDDPSAKSSTIPSHSEVALYDALMPVLYPGNIQEILDLGRLGFELSRYSGLWTGFKIVTNVADEFSSATVSPDRIQIAIPEFMHNGKTWQHSQSIAMLGVPSLMMEKEAHEGRLEAAKVFAAANNINQITVNPSDAWIGIIAAGKTYYDVRQAFQALGLSDADLENYGIRLLKLGMIFPLEPAIVREFANGLEEILVIEEKRAFVEMFTKELLYDMPNHPRIIGKRDENDTWFVPPSHELDADIITKVIVSRLKQRITSEDFDTRLKRLTIPVTTGSIPLIARTPYFCSGCPHNRSTIVPEGSIGAGGIGCHTMALLMNRDTVGVTQMGGEGAQWVGMSHFHEMNHIFQNIGDGTFAHSGSMAIRQSIAANVNITYKILYNSAVAMTGGQVADGGMPVSEMTRLLEAEGVKQIYVLSPEPDKYSATTRWASNVTIWHRDKLDEAQKILRETSGVTALIYDQECAANLRRKRRRGLVENPAMTVFINEAVCEGCGDCGVKSNCLSVQPVETEFGRKTQIHQSSCNKDFSCLDGNCPAFMTIIPSDIPVKQAKAIYKVEREIPEPVNKISGNANIYMMGIGGTGVVTTNQIVATAAILDKKHVTSLDQTGLSQKGGPVVSNLKISDSPLDESNLIAIGQADAYLVFDVLTATVPKNLGRANPDRSVAIVSTSQVPTGAMVSRTDIHFPESDRLLQMINERTKSDNNVFFDATGLAEILFDNHMAANLIVIGAAYQSGLLPMRAEAIEHAIKLNGVKVDMNINAFRAGRLTVADPQWVKTIEVKRAGAIATPKTENLPTHPLMKWVESSGELHRLMAIRVPELVAYQNEAYAQTYVDFVQKVYEKEQQICPGSTDLSEGVARYLYKLMAYKDEYEVARLHLKSDVQATMQAQFGKNAKVHYMLHPPIFKKFGLGKKLKLGKWFDNAYRLLLSMKGLRGTAFDIFGYDSIRKIERALIPAYRGLIDEALSNLAPDSYSDAVTVANLPDMIRGYDEVKLANIEKFQNTVREMGYMVDLSV